MKYFIRKWSKKARKSMVLHLLDPHAKVNTSLSDVADNDKCKVTQITSYLKDGYIQSSGFYGISKDEADRFIKKVYEIKHNMSLELFKELWKKQ